MSWPGIETEVAARGQSTALGRNEACPPPEVEVEVLVEDVGGLQKQKLVSSGSPAGDALVMLVRQMQQPGRPGPTASRATGLLLPLQGYIKQVEGLLADARAQVSRLPRSRERAALLQAISQIEPQLSAVDKASERMWGPWRKIVSLITTMGLARTKGPSRRVEPGRRRTPEEMARVMRTKLGAREVQRGGKVMSPEQALGVRESLSGSRPPVMGRRYEGPVFSPLGGYRVPPVDRMSGSRKRARRSGREQPFLTPEEDLIERIARTGFDTQTADEISRRNAWITYLARLRKAADKAGAEVLSQGKFASGKHGRKLLKVLSDFCHGKADAPLVAMPKSRPMSRSAVKARFREEDLSEIVAPMPSRGGQVGLALTAQPVGSPRGTGTSPSSASSDRYGHYLDVDGLIKRRKHGKKQQRLLGLHLGNMRTVQRVRAKS